MSVEGESCVAEGVELGHLLARVEAAYDSHDTGKVLEDSAELVEKVKAVSCLSPASKFMASNQADALASFARQRDMEGVKQAVAALRDSLGVPELREKFERHVTGPSKERVFRPQVPSAPKIFGYRVAVDGKTELKFVPRKDAPEAFEAFSAENPGKKVELVPIEAPEG